MLRGVVLFCHAHKLLQLTASHPVSEKMEWAEVFLAGGAGREEEDSSDPVYQLPRRRTFLLAIALVRTVDTICLSVCLSKIPKAILRNASRLSITDLLVQFPQHILL